MARREVAIGPLAGRKLRRISLLAAQAAERAKEAAVVLGVTVARCQDEQDEQYCSDDDSSAISRRIRVLPRVSISRNARRVRGRTRDVDRQSAVQ